MEIIKKKNVATVVWFPLTDATGTAIEAAGSLDTEVDAWNEGGTPDGFVDCTNEATALGSGAYYLSLTQAEMNYDHIVICVKSSDIKPQFLPIRTVGYEPTGILATSGNVAAVGAEVTEMSGAVAVPSNFMSIVTGIDDLQTDLDNPTQYMASVTGIDTIITDIATVQADLDDTNQYKADVTGINTNYDKIVEASGGIVDILVDTSTTIPGTITTMQADLDDTAQYKADVSELANISGYIQPIPIDIAEISGAVVDYANYKADVSELANISGYVVDTEGNIRGGTEDLETLSGFIADISAGGATAQEVWEYASPRSLSTPADYKADVTGIDTLSGYMADTSGYIAGLNDIAAADVWTEAGRALTTPSDYRADVTGLDTLSGDVISIKTKTDNLPADTSGMMVAIRGLIGWNVYSTFTWASDDNTRAVIQLYDTAFNAGVHDGASGFIDSFSVTGTYTDNELQTFKMVKD